MQWHMPECVSVYLKLPAEEISEDSGSTSPSTNRNRAHPNELRSACFQAQRKSALLWELVAS
jgi:hypothetical protein